MKSEFKIGDIFGLGGSNKWKVVKVYHDRIDCANLHNGHIHLNQYLKAKDVIFFEDLIEKKRHRLTKIFQ